MTDFPNGGFEDGDGSHWIFDSLDPAYFATSIQTATKIEGSYALWAHHSNEDTTLVFFYPDHLLDTSTASGFVYYTKVSTTSINVYGGLFGTESYENLYYTFTATEDAGDGWIKWVGDFSTVSPATYNLDILFVYESDPGPIPEFDVYLDGATVLDAIFTKSLFSAKYNIVDDTNLITNGDFETGDFTSWATDLYGDSENVEVSTLYKYSGTYGVLLKASATGLGSYQQDATGISQTINGNADEDVIISFRYKIPYAKCYTDGSYFVLRHRYDGGDDWYSEYPVKVDCTQDDWRLLQATVNLRATTDLLILNAFAYQGSSTTDDSVFVYVDDIQVQMLGATTLLENIITKSFDGTYDIINNPPANYLSNGSFETGDFTSWTITTNPNGGTATTSIDSSTPIEGVYDACLYSDTHGVYGGGNTTSVTVYQDLVTGTQTGTIYFQYCYRIPHLDDYNTLIDSGLFVQLRGYDGITEGSYSILHEDENINQVDAWQCASFTYNNAGDFATLRLAFTNACVTPYGSSGRGYVTSYIDAITAQNTPATIIDPSLTLKNLNLRYNIRSNSDILGEYSISFGKFITDRYRIRSNLDVESSYKVIIRKDFNIPYKIRFPTSVLTLSYYIFIMSPATVDYRINSVTPASLVSQYKIANNGSNRFILEIWDPVFTNSNFYNLEVTKKIEQVDTLSVTLFGISTESATVLKENMPVRLRCNGRFLFAGIVKRVTRDDNKRMWDIWAESNACILRDYKINANKDYKQNYILQEIVPDIIPQDGTWTLNYDGIEMDKKIDYKLTPGGAMAHITNLCKWGGWEWMTWMENDTYTVSSISGSNVTFSTSVGSASKYTTGFGVVALGTGTATNTGFAITSATGSTITANKNLESAGVEVGDKITLWGRNVLYITPRLGNDTITLYATQNYNVSGLTFATNLDKTFTHVLSTGVTPELIGYTTEATANGIGYATVGIDETYLTTNVASTDVYMYVNNADGFYYPSKYQVDDEVISVQEITDVSTSYKISIKTTTNRGINTTTATNHYIGAPFVCITMLPAYGTYNDDFSPRYTAVNGEVWIGSEKIGYEYVSGDGFWKLTRGVDGTTVYKHLNGTIIRAAEYDESPYQTSPASLYSLRSGRYEANGVTTKDGADKYVSSVLLKTATLIERGSFTLLDTDIWHLTQLGDTISITKTQYNTDESRVITPSTTSSTSRIVSMRYKQFEPLYIEFGDLDNYILDSFSKLDYSKDLAAQKGANDETGTAITVSDDEKYVLVQKEDGTQEWVKII